MQGAQTQTQPWTLEKDMIPQLLKVECEDTDPLTLNLMHLCMKAQWGASFLMYMGELCSQAFELTGDKGLGRVIAYKAAVYFAVNAGHLPSYDHIYWARSGIAAEDKPLTTIFEKED